MFSSLTQARQPHCTATVETHTMGTSLHRYLEIKMHQAIRERPYRRITVVGEYINRTNKSPSVITFDGEKTDKEFNWQRPTAVLVGDELQIQCFPGYDHVEHYAQLIATYLQLHQQIVGCEPLTLPCNVTFVPPSCLSAHKALHTTNLKELPSDVDTVVLGIVHHFARLLGRDVQWEGGDGCFGWVVQKFNTRKVAFVGCRMSFWGDLAGEVVHYVAYSLPLLREVLYCGKLGSVKKGIRPNTYLATGERSYVHGRLVEWENPLEAPATLLAPDRIIVGDHVTVGSVMHETKEWLRSLPGTVSVVDPEIGTMALAAVRSRVQFGYLHIISDNVAQKYVEDLSNEREQSVLMGRTYLYDLVQEILHHHLSGSSLKTNGHTR